MLSMNFHPLSPVLSLLLPLRYLFSFGSTYFATFSIISFTTIGTSAKLTPSGVLKCPLPFQRCEECQLTTVLHLDRRHAQLSPAVGKCIVALTVYRFLYIFFKMPKDYSFRYIITSFPLYYLCHWLTTTTSTTPISHLNLNVICPVTGGIVCSGYFELYLHNAYPNTLAHPTTSSK